MAPKTSASPPPVDMNRLADLSEGDRRQMKGLVDLYIRTMSDQMKKLQAAVAASQPDEVKRLAHSCAGASAMIGMNAVIGPFRELEPWPARGDLSRAQRLLGEARQTYDEIKAFLKTSRLFIRRRPYGKHKKS